jgi:hypothetical protein
MHPQSLPSICCRVNREPNIHSRGRLDRIPHEDISDNRLRVVRLRRRLVMMERRHTNDVKFVSNDFVRGDRLVIRMAELNDNRLTSFHLWSQNQFEKTGKV